MRQCMSERSSRRRTERGAAVLLFTLMIAAVLLPLVGLSIDGGLAYLAHARLVAAVDGASLAISRAPQSSGLAQLATQYVEANFPAQMVNATSPKVDVDSKTLTVRASTKMGLCFLGILGKPTISISAESHARHQQP
jgi:Flp pilus assembly protein TadG